MPYPIQNTPKNNQYKTNGLSNIDANVLMFSIQEHNNNKKNDFLALNCIIAMKICLGVASLLFCLPRNFIFFYSVSWLLLLVLCTVFNYIFQPTIFRRSNAYLNFHQIIQLFWCVNFFFYFSGVWTRNMKSYFK